MTHIVPVILCGGSGTRLWPRSRATKPKPFLPLIGDATLFEATLGRCSAEAGFAPPIVVTGKAHLEHVEAQIANSPGAAIIVEPAAKNTAAAIALAALGLPDEAVMLVCPSDHHIADPKAFAYAAQSAAATAEQGWLVSFGIEATAPETGFGYLKKGGPIGKSGYRVDWFVEKPDLGRAKAMLEEGGYSWNGGIFAFRVKDYLAELEEHRPDILAAVRASFDGAKQDGNRIYPDAAAFSAINGESVDYAVMERTGRAAMVPVSMGWSDIGNWQALHDARPRDRNGNSITGDAELVDCHNVLVDTDGPHVSVIGLEDVIVVVDGNNIMITTAAGVQKVGKLGGAVNQ